ncbi:hypothetical protein VTL71DRAFT_3722 [Oculimacula yallundae]|uniref:Uncharacterized protein n=1 Tax=Oculimacula yallundae TaxID=86028 RepID=A0ABR4C4I2_9HELO
MSSPSSESSARASKQPAHPPIAIDTAKPKPIPKMSALARAKAKRQKMLDNQMDYSEPAPASYSTPPVPIPARVSSGHFASQTPSESRGIWRPQDHSVNSLTTATHKQSSDALTPLNKNTQAEFEKSGKVSSGSSVGRPYSYADEDRPEKIDWVKKSDAAFLAASRKKTAAMLKEDRQPKGDSNPYRCQYSDDEDEEDEHFRPEDSFFKHDKQPTNGPSFRDITRGRSSILDEDEDLAPPSKKRRTSKDCTH